MEASGQSEVADLDGHILGEEHVAEFEVAVDDARRVDVTQPVHQLAQVEADLGLRQRLAVFHHVHQTLHVVPQKSNKTQNKTKQKKQ